MMKSISVPYTDDNFRRARHADYTFLAAQAHGTVFVLREDALDTIVAHTTGAARMMVAAAGSLTAVRARRASSSSGPPSMSPASSSSALPASKQSLQPLEKLPDLHAPGAASRAAGSSRGSPPVSPKGPAANTVDRFAAPGSRSASPIALLLPASKAAAAASAAARSRRPSADVGSPERERSLNIGPSMGHSASTPALAHAAGGLHSLGGGLLQESARQKRHATLSTFLEDGSAEELRARLHGALSAMQSQRVSHTGQPLDLAGGGASSRSANNEGPEPLEVRSRNGLLWHCVAHRKQRHVLVEFEPAVQSVDARGRSPPLAVAVGEGYTAVDPTNVHRRVQHSCRALLDACAGGASAEKLYALLVREMIEICGYERCILVQFAAEEQGGHCRVVEESQRPGHERPSFRGHHFPAADVPNSARKRFARLTCRIISNVNGEQQELRWLDTPPEDELAASDASSGSEDSGPPGLAFDMNDCHTRGLIDCAKAYYVNMGVCSVLLFAILNPDVQPVQGPVAPSRSSKKEKLGLWGFVSMHNYAPRYADPATRNAIQLLTSVFREVLRLEAMRRLRQDEAEARAFQSEIMSSVKGTGHFIQEASLKEAVKASHGCTVISHGVVVRQTGICPEPAAALATLDAMRRAARLGAIAASGPWEPGTMWHTDCLKSVSPDFVRFADRAAGALAVLVSARLDLYIIWWRRPQEQEVVWAGAPEYPLSPETLAFLGPRRSFEQWREIVRDRSQAWLPSDLTAAQVVRATLSDAVRINWMLLEANKKLTASNRALEKMAGELRDLIAQNPCPIFRVGADGRIREWNPAAVAATGFSREEAIGALAHRLLSGGDVDIEAAVQNIVETGLRGYATRSVDLFFRTRDQAEPREFNVLTGVQYHRDRSSIEGVIVVCQDMSKHKELWEAKSANEAKSTFIATISHEMRTPLNGILGMLTLAADFDMPTEAREFVANAALCGEYLQSLIGDVLDVSLIEAKKLVLKREPFELLDTIQSAVVMLAPKADSKGMAIAMDVHPGFPGQVVGDADRVRQVVINLLSNAVKYSPNERPVTVTCHVLEVFEDAIRVRVAVADEGIGLKDEDKPKLFTLFTRIRDKDFSDPGGTGLGLWLCKDLIHLMGGDIGCESEYGKGSTFWFVVTFPVLPRPTAELRPSMILRSLTSSGANSPIGGNTFPPVRRALVAGGELAAQLPHERVGDGALPGRLLLGAPGGAGALETLSPDILANVAPGPPGNFTLPNGTAAHGREEKRRGSGSGELRSSLCLLVEDNLMNSQVAKRFLMAGKHDVICAFNGQEALEIYKKHCLAPPGQPRELAPIDVIFMDCEMPIMNGYEATAAIREFEADRTLPPIPIIALTAHALRENHDKCFAVGMNDYLTKPIHRTTILSAVSKWTPT
eukprot:tig00020941_g16237.t1